MIDVKVGDVLYRYEDNLRVHMSVTPWEDNSAWVRAVPHCYELTVLRKTDCFLILSGNYGVEVKRSKRRRHAWAYPNKHDALIDYIRRKNWQIKKAESRLRELQGLQNAAETLLWEIAP
jgi:hypothetical protein